MHDDYDYECSKYDDDDCWWWWWWWYWWWRTIMMSIKMKILMVLRCCRCFDGVGDDIDLMMIIDSKSLMWPLISCYTSYIPYLHMQIINLTIYTVIVFGCMIVYAEWYLNRKSYHHHHHHHLFTSILSSSSKYIIFMIFIFYLVWIHCSHDG